MTSDVLRSGDDVVVRLMIEGVTAAYLRGSVVLTMPGADRPAIWGGGDAVLVRYLVSKLGREFPIGAWVPVASVGRWHDNPCRWRIGELTI